VIGAMLRVAGWCAIPLGMIVAARAVWSRLPFDGSLALLLHTLGFLSLTGLAMATYGWIIGPCCGSARPSRASETR
jgi:hypothetical protein